MKILIHNAYIWQWSKSGNHISNGGSASSALSWVVVEHGRIIDIGNLNLPTNLESFDTVIDAKERLILPGLIDSHIHVAMTGESRYFLDLASCVSIEDMKRLLHTHNLKHPDLPWIQGINWDQCKLQRYPNRDDLDSIIANKPVFLWRSCWHIGVANSVALKLALILDSERNSFDVDGGVIDLDCSGSPTGILRERAVESIISAIGMKTPSELERYIVEGLALCSQVGLTSVHTNDEGSFSVYRKLQEERKLPLRVFLTPNFTDLLKLPEHGGILGMKPFRPSSFMLSQANATSEHKEMNSLDSLESYLFVERLKIFSDGSLGAETAALRSSNHEEYQKSAGVLVHSNNHLQSMITDARREGYRLEIHAIGDAAAEQVLDALIECGVQPNERPIITHCQVLGIDLIVKMKYLNAIANVQPSFVPTDMSWINDRLSAEQHQYAYAWRTLLKNGIVVAGGSDSPIESCAPFTGMYDAIQRCGRGTDSKIIYRESERLSFSESLWLYTMGGAYTAGCEHIQGSIQIGYAADLILVDSFILEDYELLLNLIPDIVMVGGNIVFNSNQFNFTNAGIDNEYLQLSSTICMPSTSQGPFIPGKNGYSSRHNFGCCCILKSKGRCKAQINDCSELESIS